MSLEKYAYGVSAIKASEIDPTDGSPVELLDVGEVYRDTAEVVVDDPTVTGHFSEFSEDAIISTARKGEKTINFNLMDTSAANCQKWMGGELVEVADQPDIWEEAPVQVDLYKVIELTFENGAKYTVHRGRVMAKLVPNPTRPGFTVIQVMVRPVKPLADLPIISKTDPTVAAE